MKRYGHVLRAKNPRRPWSADRRNLPAAICLPAMALSCHRREPASEAKALTSEGRVRPPVEAEAPAEELATGLSPDERVEAQDHRGESQVGRVGSQQPPGDPFETPLQLSTVSITLERTGCGAGSCPSYTVVVEGTGHVRYLGRSSVKQLGDHWGVIGEAAVRALVEEFRQSDFFQLRDSYKEHIVDHSTTFLTLRIGAREKRIENMWEGTDVAEPFNRAPDVNIHIRLDSLALAVDRAVGIEQWIGAEPERVRINR